MRIITGYFLVMTIVVFSEPPGPGAYSGVVGTSNM